MARPFAKGRRVRLVIGGSIVVALVGVMWGVPTTLLRTALRESSDCERPERVLARLRRIAKFPGFRGRAARLQDVWASGCTRNFLLECESWQTGAKARALDDLYRGSERGGAGAILQEPGPETKERLRRYRTAWHDEAARNQEIMDWFGKGGSTNWRQYANSDLRSLCTQVRRFDAAVSPGSTTVRDFCQICE